MDHETQALTPGTDSGGFWPSFPVVTVLLAGVLLSFAGYLAVQKLEQAQARDTLQAVADERNATLQAHVDALQDLLANIGEQYIADAGSFDSTHFTRLTEVIFVRHREIKSLQWIPRVLAEERSVFETFAEREGLPGFQITERDSEGGVRPVAQRAEYYPMVYFASRAPGPEPLLGLDQATVTERWLQLQAARDSGQMQVYELPDDEARSGEAREVMSYVPIYDEIAAPAGVAQRRAALRGFVLTRLDVSEFIRGALRGDGAPGLDVYVYDGSPADDRLLHYSPSRLRGDAAAPHSVAAGAAGLSVSAPVMFGARPWTVVYEPLPDHFAPATWSRWSVFAAGLLLTLLLARYLLFSINRRRDVESLVALRTAELSEREARLSAVMDSAVDGIITIDARGIMVSVNRASQRLFGYEEQELIGHNVSMLMGEPYRSAHDGYLARYRATGERHIIGVGREVEAQRKDGTVFPVELAVSEFEIGGECMFTGMVRDITERRKVDRMKNEFVSTVSHELRTPLTSIVGSLGLMRGEAFGKLPEQVRAMIDIAYKNSDRLVRLINDILDIEKIESGRTEFHLKPLDIGALVEQAVEANHGYAQSRGVALQVTARTPGCSVRGDADRLMQVMANLISNAVKHSAAGQGVEVSVAEHEGMARAVVRDHGPGIPESFRDRVFDKFTQADASDTRRMGGTGLGLSICKAIVERHGGRIGFDSAPGAGATFYFELPALQVRISEVKAPAKLSCACRHVLVCEDDVDVANLLRLMLVRDGFEVDIARSAAQAREALSRREYAAMTLDVGLPDQDGISLLKELRARPETHDLQIVIVSAAPSSRHADALSGAAVGIVDWLEKPIDEQRLNQALRQVIDCEQLNRPHILHVEDDVDLLTLTSSLLHDVATLVPASSVAQARERLMSERFDLVILDLMLPDGDGEQLLALTQEPYQASIPVIVFSARDFSEKAAANVAAALVKSHVSLDALGGIIRNVIGERRGARRSQAAG